jgi:hypothetical protein
VYLSNLQFVCVDASIVLAYKFQMVPRQHRVKGGDPIYVLLDESLDVIHSTLDVL